MENCSSAADMVVPTEDVVDAFLKFFVDPLLPLGSSRPPQAPSQSEKESVAKQMHAVVLLYNYYQRKQDPETEYVGFESFCKLAVTLRPSLSSHMRYMHDESDNNKSKEGDLDNIFSETEKAILDACNVSLVLNPLKDNPNTEKWPVSKVAVLLVDSVKKNCFLLFSYLTKWVWSLIEKDVADVTSESKRVGKLVYKRKGTNRKSLQEDADVDRFQQLAFAAVKEETGINQDDLIVVETHVVYSLSKERTATRFYIVQCTQTVKEDIRFPLEDLIGSLQGPLVKQSSGYCMATSVAKYYHMLPYAAILSDWFSRQDVRSNNSQGLKKMGFETKRAAEEEEEEEEEEVGEIKEVLSNTRQKQNSGAETESLKHKDSNNGLDGTDVDKSSSFCSPQKDAESQRMFIDDNVNNRQKRKSCSTEKTDINALTTSVNLKAEVSNRKLIAYESRCDKGFENKLSQTALGVLLKKRKNLSHQLRTLIDEVAVCDQTIKTILDGGDINMALSLQVVIDCCNEGQDKDDKVERQQRLFQQLKQNTLSEAILSSKSPCQELDDICKENNWTLPSYSVLSCEGGFSANVRLKGIDFELLGESDIRPMPVEARESAAAKIISKLRH